MPSTLMSSTSWTRPSGRWSANAPFAGLGNPVAAAAATGGALAVGRAVVTRVASSKLLSAIAVGLGVSAAVGLFSDDSEVSWKDGETFDQRMALMHQMWLKLNDRLVYQCPAFVQGPYIEEYRHDRENFGQFYSKTGQVSQRAPFNRTPTAAEVGAAKGFWNTLVGWIAIAEQSCPGKVAPGLSLADNGESREPWTWQWWALGGAGVLLGLAYFATKRGPQVYVGGAGVNGLADDMIDRETVLGRKWVDAAERMRTRYVHPAYARKMGPRDYRMHRGAKLPKQNVFGPEVLAAIPLDPAERDSYLRSAADRMRTNWLKTYGVEGLDFPLVRRRRRRGGSWR